jgi:DNA repair exonuclease SbcCD nuclease subunit
MPLRLLHTADWQLGLRAAQVGERAGVVRAERLRALERLVVLAGELRPDLVVAAGDLFDRPEVDEETVAAAIELLDRLAPTPVVLLPGNHDPLDPGGVWERRIWSGAPHHLYIARSAEELVLEGLPDLALYPCPLSQKQSQRDPTAWIPARSLDDERLRVGVAHGALASLPGSANFPIAPDRAEAAGLDYLALGDWHGVKLMGRTAYSGTIEQTSFGERLAGWALLVELERGAPPRIEQHNVGRLLWRQVDFEVCELDDLARLEAEVAAFGPADTLLLRARVEVLSSDEEVLREVDELERRLAERVLHLDFQTKLHRLGTLTLDAGVLAEVDVSLAALLAGESLAGVALERVAPDVVSEARAHLRRLLATSASPRGAERCRPGAEP